MDDNPLESGLLFTCKLKTDTDFLGRTALEVSISNQQTDKQTGGVFCRVVAMVSKLLLAFIIYIQRFNLQNTFTGETNLKNKIDLTFPQTHPGMYGIEFLFLKKLILRYI